MANLTYYVLMNTFGFIYVNVSNMNCSRASLFHSSYASSCDFVQTLAYAPVFYFISSMFCLRAPTDTFYSDLGLLSEGECMRSNLGIWTVGHMAGLQYTHLNQGWLKDFSYSQDAMSGWSAKLWAFGTLVAVFYFGNVAFAAHKFIEAGRGAYFALCFFLAFVPFTLITICLRKTHKVHLHHYSGAMMGLPIVSYPHWWIIMICGWTNGVMIEGAARWGYDPHWFPIDKRASKTS